MVGREKTGLGASHSIRCGASADRRDALSTLYRPVRLATGGVPVYRQSYRGCPILDRAADSNQARCALSGADALAREAVGRLLVRSNPNFSRQLCRLECSDGSIAFGRIGSVSLLVESHGIFLCMVFGNNVHQIG